MRVAVDVVVVDVVAASVGCGVWVCWCSHPATLVHRVIAAVAFAVWECTPQVPKRVGVGAGVAWRK